VCWSIRSRDTLFFKPAMNVKHSHLRVHPKELNFPPPLNRVITNILKLQNTSTEYSVAYKVKTTAPQRYCVRPNTGVLQPKETIEVQVLLNYVKDSPLSLDCKDKFQIQSIILKDPHADIKEVWANTKEDDIVKLKLKAKFAPPKASADSGEDDKSKKLDEHIIYSTTPPIPPLMASAEIHKLDFSKPDEDFIAKDSPRTITNPVVPPIPTTVATTTTSTPVYRSAMEIPTGVTLDTHASLRMALDQVVAATNEKDTAQQQNTILNEKIKSLSEQMLLLKKERESTSSTVGLRQRNVSNPPASNLSQHQAVSTTSTNEVRYDRIVLIVIMLLIAFFFGRWSK